MQLSRFWTGIIKPILEIVHPSTIVEIGSESGEHTLRLLEFCEASDCTVHVIDPMPQFSVEAWQRHYESRFVFHKDLSLNVLPRIGHCDAVLIDGDHNWYTVFHELLLLEKNSDPQSPFPIVFLHDIDWPYGRRDMYHDPEVIPPAFRKAYRRKGVLPGHGQPVKHGGLNSTFYHAVEENNVQNGVLTAIEDFLAHTKHMLRFIQVPGGHGLGILVDAKHLETHEELIHMLDALEPPKPLRSHMRMIDEERMNRVIRVLDQQQQLLENNATLQRLQQDYDRKQAELDLVRSENDGLTLANAQLNKDKQLLKAAHAELETSRTATKLQLHLQTKELECVFATRSWKWTKPIRHLEGAVRTLLNTSRPERTHADVASASTSAWSSIEPDLRVPENDSLSPEGDYPAYCARTFLTEEQLCSSRERALAAINPHVVSILMPVRSFEELLLRKTCNAILEQTYMHWELIIVNDGCAHPALPVIVEDLQNAAPHHVQMIQSTEEGAERTAWHASKGTYVAWIDPHDEWEADALERIVSALQSSDTLNVGYADHDQINTLGIRSRPALKPACSPELLLHGNYIGSSFIVRKDAAAPFVDTFDHKADFRYQVLLKLAEAPERVVHVPHVLFHRRESIPTSERALAEQRAIESTLRRRGLQHAVQPRDLSQYDHPVFDLQFSATHWPMVTIIIPTKDRVDLLRRCIESIRTRTEYPAYEIIVIDNGSKELETLQYLQNADVRVVRIETDRFNFAAINTQAANAASSELLLFLNNDTEPAHPEWLRELVGTMRLDPRIGIVAPKLLYPLTVRGMRVQHAGMVLGRHLASLIQFPMQQELGWNMFNQVTHNCAAVSGAALLTKKTLFLEVGGFDAEHFAVDFCDVDYCLKVLERGFRIVCTPSAELYHLESASRGDNDGRGATLAPKEAEAFRAKWGYLLPHDPYYHPHLLRDGDLFRLDPDANLDAQPRRATTHPVDVAAIPLPSR